MKQTIIDQIEITREGHVQVRMRKLVVDGEDVFDLGYHRTIVEIGGDLDKQMAEVNAHLTSMGFGSIASEEVNEVRAHAMVAWTPERRAAFELIKAIGEEKAHGTTETKGGSQGGLK